MDNRVPKWKKRRRNQLIRNTVLLLVCAAAAAVLLIWFFTRGSSGSRSAEAEQGGVSAGQIAAESREQILDDGAADTQSVSAGAPVEAVLMKDEEAPALSGVQDRAVEVGTNLDLLQGITAEDNRDKSPVITVEPESIDTSVEGYHEVTYTVTDESGNTAEASCFVEVARQVIEVDGRTYGICWDTELESGQPYLVAVNRACNTVTVYEEGPDGTYSQPVWAAPCSVGSRGNTPRGHFTTGARYRWRSLFGNVYGQYAIVIRNNILFHSVPYRRQSPDTLKYDEYNGLGEPVSMGCIRLAVEYEKWMYDNCPKGFPCVIYDNEYVPGPLGKPAAVRIDPEDEVLRNWDPTDPDPDNPWNSVGTEEAAEPEEGAAEEAGDAGAGE